MPVICGQHNAKGDRSGMCRFGLVHHILGSADWSTDHKHKMDMLTKSDFNYPFGHYCTQNTLMG